MRAVPSAFSTVWGAAVGKTAVVLAPIIVLGAGLVLCFWLGRRYERTSVAVRGTQLSAKLHGQMVEWIRQVLNPSDLANPSFVPEDLRDSGTRLVAQADENMAKVRREDLRRRGF
jgi:hypothetical protein